jgi:hypothetical protein
MRRVRWLVFVVTERVWRDDDRGDIAGTCDGAPRSPAFGSLPVRLPSRRRRACRAVLRPDADPGDNEAGDATRNQSSE